MLPFQIDQTIQILVHRLIDHQEQQKPRKVVEETKKKCVRRTFSLDDSHSQASNQSHISSVSSTSQPISSNILFTSDNAAKPEVTATPFILNLGSVVNNNLMLVAGQSASLSVLSTCNSTKRQQQFSGKCISQSQPSSQISLFATDDQIDSHSRSFSLSQNLSDIQLCEQNSNSSYSLSKTDSFTNTSNSFLNGYQQMQSFSDDISNSGSAAPHDIANKQYGIMGSVDPNSSAQIEQSPVSQMTTMDVQKLSSTENVSLEDFNLDLMTGDKQSPMSCSQKEAMSGITDCFDRYHTNLSPLNGNDMLVNLDQLEALDLPDIEKICNDISIESNSPMSQEPNHVIHKDGHACTVLDSVSMQNGCDRQEGQGNNCIQCTCSAASNFETVTTRECTMMPARTVNSHSRALSSQHPIESPSTIAMITDFCPDWAYSEVCLVIWLGPS